MTRDPLNDPLLRLVSGLTPQAPDESRSASVKAKCHRVLARRNRQRARRLERAAWLALIRAVAR